MDTYILVWVSIIFFTDPLTTQTVTCTTGDLRLEGGPNVREGRLEVCVNNAWGTVCNAQFSDEDAEVACTQMEFEREGQGTNKCILMG